MIRTIVVGVVAAGALASGQVFSEAKSAASAYSKAELQPKGTCEALAKFKSADIAQIAATPTAANGATPAFCRVAGMLSPEIAFEVALPAKWNGRFYMIGNGGLAGESIEDAGRVGQRNAALALGFAFAQTNTGHDSRKEPSGSFILNNPQKAIDYAWRAVHLTAVTGKAIVKQYYGKAASKSYWNSCSNGGRQGLIEAQRFPDDFDGVIANSPWVDQTGFTLGAIWNQQALTTAPVTAAKLGLVAEKAIGKCDAVDGLKDGLIGDPRKCNFDPKVDVPTCAAGDDGPTCLTPAQAEAVAKVYSGPSSGGKNIFPGFMVGSEAVLATGSGWMNMIAPARADAKPADFGLAEGILRYLVLKPAQPEYDYKNFNFERDIHLVDDWGKIADAKSTDLSKFRKRGGKLMITYGWADTILQPMMGVDYYEKAAAKAGSEAASFLRLYMAPGVGHCGGGIGPDQYDSMTALIDWVETKKAPEAMVAKKIVNGSVTRSRPLCPYPQVAQYSGQGSIDEASNFHCSMP